MIRISKKETYFTKAVTKKGPTSGETEIAALLMVSEGSINDAVQELDIPRKDYVLTTKIFWGGPGPNDKGLNRKHIVEGTKVRHFAHMLALK